MLYISKHLYNVLENDLLYVDVSRGCFLCYDNFVSIIGCNLTRLDFKYLVEEKPKRVVGKQPLRSHRERC